MISAANMIAAAPTVADIKATTIMTCFISSTAVSLPASPPWPPSVKPPENHLRSRLAWRPESRRERATMYRTGVRGELGGRMTTLGSATGFPTSSRSNW